MSKQIFFDIEARNKMKKGVDTLANAVKVTLGPKGRNVVIEKKPVEEATSTSKIEDGVPPIQFDTTMSVRDTTKKINPADGYTFKIVMTITNDFDEAQKAFNKWKSYGHKVILYTSDSIMYKVAEPFTLPLADTTRVKDSLNKYYYLGKATIER